MVTAGGGCVGGAGAVELQYLGAQWVQCRCGVGAGGMAASGGLRPLPLLLLLLAVRRGQPAALFPGAVQLQLPQLYRQLDGVLDSMVSG